MYAFVVLAALMAAPSAVFSQRCADITLGSIDYSLMIQFSPFYVYVSTVAPYNCTQVMYVGTAEGRTDYTGTSIVIKGNLTYTYDIILQNSVFSATQCSDGTPAAYKVLYSNLKNSKEASFCVFVCDQTGDHIAMLACPGKTQSDFDSIKNYLATQLKVKIVSSVYNSQEICPEAKNCASFT